MQKIIIRVFALLSNVTTVNMKPTKYWLQMIPVKIFLPVFLTLVLFVLTIFLLVLPLFESYLMDGKREVILSLTESAWSTLDVLAQKERAGLITRDQAQSQAIDLLRRLRYGPESKDYYWINDMQPRLIMHPYRSDLEGENIADFTDPSGKHLFVDVVKTVKNSGVGYVDYQWQWKDDPNRIVPKISYVKGFEPWGWIIGTGIYVEDVRTEIAAITRKLFLTSVLITAIIIGLCTYVVLQGIRVERKSRDAQDALQKSEEKYRLLAETAGEFILTADLDGKITYFNKAWREAGNMAAEKLEKMNITDILPADYQQDYERILQRRIDGDTHRHLQEVEFCTSSDTRIPVEMSVSLLKDDDRPSGTLISARDITEKKRAAEQTRLHQEQLFQASKMASIGTLVSGVAHEINNPIATVLLNAPIVEKVWQSTAPILEEHCQKNGSLKIGGMDYSLLHERMPKLLSSISDGARRVKKIVGDLKDFARQSPPEMTDMLNINTAVEKVISLVSNLIKKSTNNFAVHYQSDIPTFRGNTQRIEQVVVNLLVNACQALPDNERPIRVYTGYDAVRNTVSIEVHDQGIGMSTETVKRIKDPFYTTKRDMGGTGLGLSISDKIVRDHGGTLDFFTDLEMGTTAKVSIEIGSKSIEEGRKPA